MTTKPKVPTEGDPATNEAYENLLLGAGYGLVGPLFVSAAPTADLNDFGADDPAQPAFRTAWYERGFRHERRIDVLRCRRCPGTARSTV